MRVGIVGAGHIAAIHVNAIRSRPDTEIVGVADQFVEYARSFAKEHGIPAAYASTRELIEQAGPDAVHVLTPPRTHHAVALEALQLGCHVLIEKPMTTSSRDADQLIEAAERLGRVLTVGHNLLFSDTAAQARSMIDSGRIGDVVTVEVDYSYALNRYPALLAEGAEHSHWAFQLNGGPLQDQMPHPLSLVVPYLGDVQALNAIGQNRGGLPEPWQDEIRVQIKGTKCHADVYVSFNARPDTVTFTARGTTGTIVADLYGMLVTVDGQSSLPRAVSRGLTGFRRGYQNVSGSAGNAFGLLRRKIDKTGGVRHLVASFYDAIEEGSQPPVSMHEGKQVVDLMERIWPKPLRPQQASSATARTRTKPTVLVTGASGFVGGHLIQRLIERGDSVRALVRPSSPGIGRLRLLECDIAEGDLANREHVRRAIEGIDVVYHLGGAMGGGWDVHEASTVQGTQNVLDTAADAECRRVVYFSSLVVYDVLGHRNGTEIAEDHPRVSNPEHFGPYTMGKIEAERRVAEAQRDGLPTTVIRPGMVIGPRGRVFFPHMGFRVSEKLIITPGRGDSVLPLVFVDNLVDATLAAVESTAAIGQSYNIVDDGTVTVAEYLQRFTDETGQDLKRVRVPFVLPYCAAGFYELLAMTGVVQKGATSRRQMRWKHKSLLYSSEKAKRDFGWQPSVPLDEGIKKTFEWYMLNE